MIFEKIAEVFDDLVRLVGLLVVEIDKGQTIAHVTGVIAIRKSRKVLLRALESLLVVVGHERRHGHIIQRVFDQPAVGKGFKKFLEEWHGAGEVARLKGGNAVIKHKTIKIFGLREANCQAAEKFAHLGPVSTLHKDVASQRGHLLDVIRVRIFAHVCVAELFDCSNITELAENNNLSISRRLGILCGSVFRAERAETYKRLLETIQVEKAAAAAHEQRGVEIAFPLDRCKGRLRELNCGL